MIARAGVILAVLQFAFALTWVVYVAYLPALAAQVGLSRSAVPWILLVDQAIFVVCDWLAGVHADRVGGAISRLGRQIALVTVVSCAAFLALPLVAPGGSAPLLVALVVLWSASSSILRAPSLTLAGRHASRPQRAWLASSYAFGLGAAGAMAPYLAETLATTDPRIPFVATSIVVAAITIALVAIPHAPAPASHEARSPGSPHSPHSPHSPSAPSAPSAPHAPWGFAVALALLAIGFQVHASIASPATYLRFVPRDDLADVLPVFWIGFNVAVLPLAPLVQRASGLVVMAGAGALGTVALIVAHGAALLATVVVAQLVAGLAWGGILVGAFATASVSEHRPGSTTGMVFSILAATTAARIAFVATGLSTAPDAAAVLPWLPPIAWGVATLALAATVRRRDRDRDR